MLHLEKGVQLAIEADKAAGVNSQTRDDLRSHTPVTREFDVLNLRIAPFEHEFHARYVRLYP